MRLVSWNVAGRGTRQPEQAAAVLAGLVHPAGPPAPRRAHLANEPLVPHDLGELPWPERAVAVGLRGAA